MAGTIPLSMTQQFDVYGKPLAGGQLFIMQAGTVSTPQDAFQDTGLSIKQPYPMTLDAAGRVPQFFLADGTVKIRLQDRSGVVQLASDSVMVIGPSAGGGGGGTVDPTQLIQMGNMMFRHGVGPVAGYVRLNGLTVGSAVSGATERANLDCQALFQYLWGDTALAVSGGRGVTAAADWAANKQLALPDYRGYSLAALDDMGNTPSGRLSAPWFNDPIKLGGADGAQSIALPPTSIPPHVHRATTGDDFPDHTHAYEKAVTDGSQKPAGTGTAPMNQLTPASTGGASVRHRHSLITDTGENCFGQPFRVMPPTKLTTFYIKL